MKKTFRICLLIGLILSLALFAYYTISSFIGMTAVFSILGTVGADPTFNAAGAITIGIMALMTIFGLLGLSFRRLVLQEWEWIQKNLQTKKDYQ